jgi:hypothetical protein
MDLIRPKFACSPYDESCDGQVPVFTSPIQLDQCSTSHTGYLRLSQRSCSPFPGRTIKYCDSPYHILATNVNTHLAGSRGCWLLKSTPAYGI